VIFWPYYLKQKLEETKRKWREKVENGYVWVTDMVHCPERYHLSLQYPEVSLGQFSSTQFVLGELLHRAIESDKLFEGWLKEYEVAKDYGKFKIRGQVDLWNPDEKILVEIKTGRDVKSPPSPHHILQVWIYKQILGSQQEFIIYATYGRIVEVELTQIDYQDVFTQLKAQQMSMINMPDILGKYVAWWWGAAPTPLWPWECDYCPYAHLCALRKTQNKKR